MANHETQEHGWTAVPRSLSTLISSRPDPQPARPIHVSDIPLPNTLVAQEITSYARARLSPQTFAHSMRVYYYGQAIARQHFPSWRYSAETYLLACLLHDIGTTDRNTGSTRLSFEFHGGLKALHLLADVHMAPQAQAEAVAETIIRHQDVGETGMISTLTAVIHFATLLDNVGANRDLVHEETIEDVVREWPRDGWTGCFAAVVRREVQRKPWSHTTSIEGFAEMVEGNELMRPYD